VKARTVTARCLLWLSNSSTHDADALARLLIWLEGVVRGLAARAVREGRRDAVVVDVVQDGVCCSYRRTGVLSRHNSNTTQEGVPT
jgi:hypothetical protein